MVWQVGREGEEVKRINIEYVKPEELSPNEYNPNVHEANTFDGLLDSLRRWGFTQPIVADRETKQIIDGEHRWRCSFVLQLEEVPVVFLQLSKLERMAATLQHNEARGKHCPKLRQAIERDFALEGYDLEKVLKQDQLAK